MQISQYFRIPQLSNSNHCHILYNIPKEIEAVNGSRDEGGCEVNINAYGDFLTDGMNPVLNITDPNWVSELVTVIKNNGMPHIPYNHMHVVLTLYFNYMYH